MECRIVDLQDLAYGFLDPEGAMRVRDHLADCARCRADFARLEAERSRLAGAAAGLSAPRERKNLVPLAFAAALLVGLLWLLIPREPAPTFAPSRESASEGKPAEVAAMPAAQEKKGPKEVPDDEDSLQKEIVRLDAALKTASDDQERARIKTTIADLKIRLQRALRAKDDPTAMKERGGEPKKPVVKGKTDSADDRVMKLKVEMKGLFEKIKFSTDSAEKQRFEQRVKDIDQELKLLDQSPKMQINFKEVEVRLQSNPDDVAALVDRATWYLDNGKPEPALKDLERAVAVKPDCAPAYLKRAIAYAMLGRQAEAWADVKRGEQLDMKAGKMIDETLRAVKKLTGSKDRRPVPGDTENQVATLRDRLEELRSMAANADLSAADRERTGRDADRVQAEIDRLTAELKSRPAEPEKKVEKKK
jgi:tetratricopeptide (TPR) repeat protein